MSVDVARKVEGWQWGIFTYSFVESPFVGAVIQVFSVPRVSIFFPFMLAVHLITFLLCSPFQACARQHFVFLKQGLPNFHIACCYLL